MSPWLLGNVIGPLIAGAAAVAIFWLAGMAIKLYGERRL